MKDTKDTPDIYCDIVPAFHCYMDYKSSNYGGHALCFTDANGRTWYFSYRTLVAFNTRKTGLVCLVNYWQNTTGKHLNAIQPDHKKRVDQKTFDALLILARQQ